MSLADLIKRRTCSPCSPTEKSEGTATSPVVTGCSPCSPCSPAKNVKPEHEPTSSLATPERLAAMALPPAPAHEIETIIANLTCPDVNRDLGPELIDLMRRAMRPLDRATRASLAAEIDDAFETCASVKEAREQASLAIRGRVGEPGPHTAAQWLDWIGHRVPLLKDDRAHIAAHIQRLPLDRMATLCRWYVQTWAKAADDEPLTHKKDNAGRRAANTALLTWRKSQ